jgi:hypothetical protein
MFNLQNIFSILATFFSIVCFFPYIVTTLKGKTQPNRATWWIWAINGSILCIGNYSAGASDTLWALAAPVIFQLFIALLSLKFGEGGWNRFDRSCLLGVGASFILWYIFKAALIAIFIPLIIDFLGALPTVKKSYFNPESEDVYTWLFYTIGGFFNILAITSWSFEIAITPLYVFTIDLLILIFITRNKIKNVLKFAKII